MRVALLPDLALAQRHACVLLRALACGWVHWVSVVVWGSSSMLGMLQDVTGNEGQG